MLLLVVLASARSSFRAVCLSSGLDAYLYAWMRTCTHVRKLGIFSLTKNLEKLKKKLKKSKSKKSSKKRLRDLSSNSLDSE
jgi:hypothetical protein